jgi:hypothetical protein
MAAEGVTEGRELSPGSNGRVRLHCRRAECSIRHAGVSCPEELVRVSMRDFRLSSSANERAMRFHWRPAQRTGWKIVTGTFHCGDT